MNTTRNIPYARHSIDDADVAAVAEVLRGDWLTQGPAVGVFEAALCRRFGAHAAAAVNSGTAALHLGMLALGVGPGDLVLVPPITFVASANAVLYCGADVAFIDVEPDTGLISAGAVNEFLSSYQGPLRLRAVVAVHLAGLPADMVALGQVCASHGVDLVEDACHAPGASWADESSGAHCVGDASTSAFVALSFHPVKHVATAEGGAVLSTQESLVQRVRDLRAHGVVRDAGRLERQEGAWWYEQQSLGFNYRMPDVLAALGTSQLRHFDVWLERRREIARRYRSAFAEVPEISVQPDGPERRHAYHLFPVLVEHRREVFAFLQARGVMAQVHYIPVCNHPYYRARYGTQQLIGAESWYEREISIPMYPGMSDDEVDFVCTALLEAVRRLR